MPCNNEERGLHLLFDQFLTQSSFYICIFSLLLMRRVCVCVPFWCVTHSCHSFSCLLSISVLATKVWSLRMQSGNSSSPTFWGKFRKQEPGSGKIALQSTPRWLVERRGHKISQEIDSSLPFFVCLFGFFLKRCDTARLVIGSGCVLPAASPEISASCPLP